MTFDEASLAAIAIELEVIFSPEPYVVRGATVYGATISGGDGNAVRLILWPSIGRVDVRVGMLSITFKDVHWVDIYSGVEVTFRRKSGGFLFVTSRGQVTLAV